MSFKTDKLLNQANLDEDHSSFSSAEQTFADQAEAAQIFSILKEKLLNINEWNAHSLLSTFRLFDENGQTIQNEKLSVKGFIQIALKGAVKYDWVRILDIYESENEFIITVKPTFDPTADELDESVVSHFFTDESTNNFCLLRRADTIALYVIGLNEKMNTGETKNVFEAARNAAVNVGSYLGVQRGEWEKFCHHLLEDALHKNVNRKS